MSDAALAHADTDEAPPTIAEVVEMGAVNSEFFCRWFFPRTMHQESAPFLIAVWEDLESAARLVNLQVFRGGAKTTTLRMYSAKRIAYGLAHTILYIGKSEGHAIRSVKWLRRQIEFNRRFADTFQLKRGKKWQDIESEIVHGVDEYPIWIMAMGITGSIRGILQEDFRPDLIVVDDVLDEENSATPEQRIKMEALIYGALKESLAPASESPDAKMVMLQTPLNKEDVSTKALSDDEWRSRVYGCWTPETAGLAIEHQESSWPARWTSETLRKEKLAAINRNQLSIFLREKECKLISPETSAFKPEWLQFYELEPENTYCVLVIDPVPPPSEIQIAKGLRGKDYEAFAVVGRKNGKFYLLEYSYHRGHEPDWTIAEFFRLCAAHNPRRVLVEAVAYQRTLAWLLRKAMDFQRKWYTIEEFDDKRHKYDRIVDALTPIASNKRLFVKEEHRTFRAQFTAYPDVANDDVIEAVAAGVAYLSGHRMGEGGDDMDEFKLLAEEEENILSLAAYRGCP